MIRKRWLGALLASVLIFSLAFEAVGYTEKAGENKGQTVRVASDRDECQHPSLGAPYWNWDSDDPDAGIIYVPLDNMEHSVSGIGWQEAYCPDCGKTVKVAENVELPDDFSENHHYEDRNGTLVCLDCGHENDCEHSDLDEPGLCWYEEDVEYTPIDNLQHRVEGIGCIGSVCLDCGVILKKSDDKKFNIIDNHDYDENGIYCLDCGHKNTCKHLNLDEPEIAWDPETVTYEPIDNMEHRIVGTGWREAYCPDCGVDVKVEENVEIPDSVTNNHDYDENGICRDCGHKNTCEHLNLDEPEVIWEDIECREILTDNEYHLATGTGREIAVCLDCGEEIILEENVEIDEEDAHEYDEDGRCLWCDHKQLTGWKKIEGKWYFYPNGGAAVTGWKKISGIWYYFESDGAMVTGWQKIGGKWYYFKSDGAMATGWQKIGGKWYYFQSGGAMVTGWQKIGGKWYYFQSSGAMVTGWQKISGKWYYFQSSGAMVTGWQKVGGKWYYFQSGGAMVTGTVKIGGKTYKFSSSGVWVS